MTTVGRKPRKRAPGAGSGVVVKKHSRSPRGSNKGKSAVTVNAYKRGKPRKERSRGTKKA